MNERKDFNLLSKSSANMLMYWFNKGITIGMNTRESKEEKTMLIHYAGEEQENRLEQLSGKFYALDELVDLSKSKDDVETLTELFAIVKTGVNLGKDMSDAMDLIDEYIQKVKMSAPKYVERQRDLSESIAFDEREISEVDGSVKGK